MTTKEWLRRAGNIDKQVKRAQRIAEEAYYNCTNITPSYSKDVVSGTRDAHGKLDRYIEARDDTNRIIDELVCTKNDMYETICRISDVRCRTLLISRFVKLDRWDVVAQKCGCSVPHAKYGLLAKATQHLAFVLDNTRNIW